MCFPLCESQVLKPRTKILFRNRGSDSGISRKVLIVAVEQYKGCRKTKGGRRTGFSRQKKTFPYFNIGAAVGYTHMASETPIATSLQKKLIFSKTCEIVIDGIDEIFIRRTFFPSEFNF